MPSRRRSRAGACHVGAVYAIAMFVGALGGVAYTAASSVAAGGKAGQGAAAISPYSIAGVQYTLNTNSPRNIDNVSLSVTPSAAATVKASLVTGGGWYTCSNSSGTVACVTTAPQASAATVNNLTIVAVQ